MRKIEEIPQSKLDEMKYYYDPLLAGICIQKYLETEDGKGDFIPVYANQRFAEAMGVPFEYIYLLSLRQANKEFPEKELQEMVEVAFDGRFITGDTFSRDNSKYFSTRIYQYAYGYIIMFITDVTTEHIKSNTLQSVSKAYETIYYARTSEPVCSKVYPVAEEKFNKTTYDEMIKNLISENRICSCDIDKLENFFRQDNLKSALAAEDAVSMRFQRTDDASQTRWTLAEVIVNERIEKEPAAYVITIKDIDDIVREEKLKQEELEKAYEKVKRANESKNRFLAHMSHDIRTPINGILGMIQMLEEGNASDEVRLDYRNKIKQSSENLLALFTEVLDITRLDSDDLVLEKANIDLNHARKVLYNYMVKMNLNLNIDWPEIVHPFRLGSEAYIRQIVLQIVTNAVKFNRENNPIDVILREATDSDDVTVVVKDRGIGMSQEFLTQIFEPFAQEHGDSRTTFEGTGLGMTYVKRIVDAVGGKISVESTLGEGTTVTVTIPIEIDYDKEKEKTDEAASVNFAGRKVLIVEDNDINALIVECFVEKENMPSERAVNGKIALEKFEASKDGEYSVILMDIMMPVMNGLDATVAIRNCSHPQAKTIPIIGVSANYFPEDIKRGLDAGMNAYLSKPVDRKLLLTTIGQHIKE